MRPPQVPPPYSIPISEPKSAIINIAWIKWFQNFFFADPLYTRVTSVTTTPYTAIATDEFILVSTNGGAMTVNLPASLGDIWLPKTLQSKVFIVKASGSNAVTVSGNGQNIDGAATATVAAGTTKRFINDGSQWYAY